MNHREPPLLPAGVRKAFHGLSLALLTVMAIDDAAALPRTYPPGSGPAQPHAGAIPYLSVVSAPPLRFQAPPPPITAAIVPLSLDATRSPDGLASDEGSTATASHPVLPIASNGENAAQPAATQPPESGAPTKAPPAILRDTLTPTVRAEDFLPYFQFPGSARHPSDVTVLVPATPSAPAPAPIPPSSATYRQTP